MKESLLLDKIAEKCYVDTGSLQTNYFDYQKFAEEILNECVKALDKEANLSKISLSTNNIQEFSVFKRAIGIIKEHFE